MNKIKNKKFIMMLLLLSIILLGIPKSYANNKLDEVALNKKVDKELFAIMLDQGDGTYKESDTDTWPTRYTYNEEMSGCMDINGNEVNDILQFDDTTHVATVDTSKTVYCYLYFDREKDAPTISEFYIGNNSGPEYINTREVPFYLKWDDEDVEEYCITEDDNYNNCTWHKTNESEIMVINNIKEIRGTVTIPSTNQRYVYHVYIKDDFNNVSSYGTDEITLDTTINDISKVHIGGSSNPTYVTSSNQPVYIEWSDNDIVKYCVSTSNNCTPNKTISGGATSVTSENINIGSNDGTKTVYVVIEDQAGNTKTKSDSVILDTTNPTLTLNTPTINETSIVVPFTASDTNGIANITCSGATCSCNLNANKTGTNCTFGSLTAGTRYNNTLNITATDNAGKTTTKSGDWTTKDNKASAYIEKLPTSTTKGLNRTIQGGMWRYQGTQGNVDNYICFGTDSKEICTSNSDIYMYRIIGIVQDSTDTTVSKGMIKVIKQTPLKEGIVAIFAWDISPNSVIWSDSYLKKRLNGESNRTVPGSQGDTDIFLGTSSLYNKLYPYVINTTWINKIVNKKWYYGDIHDNFKPTTAQEMFNQEYGITVAKDYTGTAKKWSQTSDEFKIGLMSLSDYYWSVSAIGVDCSQVSNRQTCMSSWIHLINNGGPNNKDEGSEWTMSRMGMVGNMNFYYDSWMIYYVGDISFNTLNKTYAVRPVFYLTADTVIKSGTGSESDPFIIQA